MTAIHNTPHATLLEQMHQGAIVITPNNRLSRYLLQAYHQYHQKTVIAEPSCFPFKQFLHRCYQELKAVDPNTTRPLLLNTAQTWAIWKIVLGDLPQGLIVEIEEARRRCIHWNLDATHPEFLHTPQTRQFKAWWEQFHTHLHRLHAITEVELPNYLMTHLDLLPKQTHIWACFDELTPLQCKFQTALGTTLHHYDLATQTHSPKKYAALDPQDEWLHMIQWIHQRLAEKDTQIGIVVPNLHEEAPRLKRFLLQHLPADSFNLSLGTSLAQFPLIAHALLLLKLNLEWITQDEILALLHSPFIEGAQLEFEQRSESMLYPELLKEERCTFEHFLKTLNDSILKEKLSQLLPYPQNASASSWCTYFKTRLQTLGFPGEVSLNSEAYQHFQRFLGFLDTFASLNLVCEKLPTETALEYLTNLAENTAFQPKKPKCPIHILGLLEASGCLFDSLWITSLTDQCLPPKTQLSAFIPIELQRDLQMPRSSANRELSLAMIQLQRLQNSSPNLICSFPKMTGDTPNLESPLIAQLPMYTSILPQEISKVCLVPYDVTYRVPLLTGETLRGGTQLLSNQAQCPFKAFAKHRLHLTPEIDSTRGPNAMERGQILHLVMDKLWSVLQDQAKLLTMSDEQLHALLDRIISSILTPLSKTRHYSVGPLVQSIEASRLKLLAKANLDWEKTRAPFKIHALEKQFSIQLAGIDFNVRIDRLDQVNDKKWVIDYKTTMPSNKPWHEDRPEEPQLLLYALLDQDINALLFLQLKAGRLTCSGFSEQSVDLKGISALKGEETWENYQQAWQMKLLQLAEEVHGGICTPTPLRPSICSRCEEINLCRI